MKSVPNSDKFQMKSVPNSEKFQMKSLPNSEYLFTYLFWVSVTVLFQTNLYARVQGFQILLAHKHKIFASFFGL